MINPLLLVASLSWAAAPALPTLTELHDRFIETTQIAARMDLLPQIARTRPVNPQDVSSLFDLYSRFQETAVRSAVLDSVHLLTPSQRGLEPALLILMEDKDPDAQLFGIHACLSIRSPRGLKLIEDLSKDKFEGKTAAELTTDAEKARWWVTFEALSAVAQWKGEEAFDEIEKQSRRAPPVAAILATNFWKKTLPLAAGWARSSKDRERAENAFGAPVDYQQLVEVRDEMLALLKDVKLGREVRHRLAIKIGRCTDDAKAEVLAAEIEKTGQPELRLLLTTALFASNSKHAIPLLKSFAEGDPKPSARAAARLQLKDLMEPKDYRELLEWAAANDQDAENREEAKKELAALKKPAK
jgi:hypothetical protein